MYAKKPPKITKKEQELLQLLDEELALPPLPRDFVGNVVAHLGIGSQLFVPEVATEPAISASSSDTPEVLYLRGREAVEFLLQLISLYRRYDQRLSVLLDSAKADKWISLSASVFRQQPGLADGSIDVVGIVPSIVPLIVPLDEGSDEANERRPAG